MLCQVGHTVFNVTLCNGLCRNRRGKVEDFQEQSYWQNLFLHIHIIPFTLHTIHNNSVTQMIHSTVFHTNQQNKDGL